MITIKKIIALPILVLVLILSSCTDDFDAVNKDPRNFTLEAVTSENYPLFFEKALYAPNYAGSKKSDAGKAMQRIKSLSTDLYARYFSTTHPNFNSDQLAIIGNWYDYAFKFFYSKAAPNIKYTIDAANEFGFAVEGAIAKVWKVYAFHRITDIWGPIPYSQFGNFEKSVAYDSQEDIYNSFFIELDEAVAILKSNTGSTSFLSNNDIIYEGDVDKWLKFANTLRLRLAMRIKYVNLSKSQLEAEKAIADGVMESNADNAYVKTRIDFRNPYNKISQWGEFRMSADMESYLKGYLDPRVSDYYQEATIADATDDPIGITFNWEGMRNGQTKSSKQAIVFNDLASDIGALYNEAEKEGPDLQVLRASEAYFLRAEGVLEGWNMGGGTAQSYYEQGIETSLNEYGYTKNLAGNNYATSSNIPASLDTSTPAISSVPVAFNTTGTSEEMLEQIITQKWIALYPDSKEAYAELRRTGYPKFYDRLNSLNPDFNLNKIPRRLPFVSGEYSSNTNAVEAAVLLLGGVDAATTKLWWDKK